jgi:hypothetical protein
MHTNISASVLNFMLFLVQCMSLLLCRFSAAGMMVYRRAPAAGGRKAPRHEIA